MIITLLAPETIMGLASSSLWSARSNNKKLKDLACQDGVAWSIAHTFYADMGGFVIVFNEHDVERTAEGFNTDDSFGQHTLLVRTAQLFQPLSMDRLHRLGDPHWKVDSKNRDMALKLRKVHAEDSLQFKGNIWALSAAQLALARNLGIIDRLPNLSKDELADKNKGDLLVKGFAILQIIWMLVQLVVRWYHQTPASQLEVMTLSFAACALLIYALLWSRPQGVETPVVIRGNRAPRDGMKSLAEIKPGGLWIPRNLYTMPNHVVHHEPAMSVGFGAGTLLFGLLHLIAWDFTFPTQMEKLLWKVSTFVTIAVPVAFVMIDVHLNLFRLNDLFGQAWARILLYLSLVAIVVARMFLLVESFRSLYFLPPSVFKNTWASNIPHLS
jgi:hypothetical protein